MGCRKEIADLELGVWRGRDFPSALTRPPPRLPESALASGIRISGAA